MSRLLTALEEADRRLSAWALRLWATLRRAALRTLAAPAVVVWWVPGDGVEVENRTGAEVQCTVRHDGAEVVIVLRREARR